MPQIKVGTYLFTRLKQLGVKTIWGVPGDYELALLDLVEDAGAEFSGNANELIASYAADGYGRLNGVGAWIDTYGPGELSAYCGQAGAYTEFVPVAHVVGYPRRDAMTGHRIMHHTLGTGEFGMFESMVKHISAATSVLWTPEEAPNEIDRCLTTMLQESRPCYIGVPVDMSHLMCDSSGLERPLVTALPPNDPSLEKMVVDQLRERLDKAKSPVIIVDGNAIRGGVTAECAQLSQITNLPTFVTFMGKGGFDEDAPNFGGVYCGNGTVKGTKETVESSDLVLWVGNFPSDFNTAEFSDKVATDVTMEFQRFFVKIGSQKYDVKMKYVLQGLIKSLESTPLASTAAKVTWDPFPYSNPERGTKLSQDYLWAALSKFFRPGDFVIAETGTSAYGIAASKLPSGASLFNQTVFGSIGYATGAAAGAFQSIRETAHYKRCILVTGEGSLQLTVQAFADMLKLKMNPIIFVLNNNGYTIERLIHGKDAKYNHVVDWDYSLLATAFGSEFPSRYWGQIGTADELDKVLADGEFNDGECFKLCELKLGYLDAPAAVRQVSGAVEAFNKS